MNPAVLPPAAHRLPRPTPSQLGALANGSPTPCGETETRADGDGLAPGRDDAHFLEAAERLSAALFHVIHQTTAKGRDRSLGALVALIYGPTPFGGVNNLKEVASRYGMTEQNLFQLMRAHRELLARPREPEYQI